MEKPVLSSDFTMEDIRKLRDYNSSRHATMTVEEIKEDLRPSVERFIKHMSERKQISSMENR